MVKKILLLVVPLAIIVLVVALVLPMITEERPQDLLVRAKDIEKSALDAFEAGDYETARSLYMSVLDVLEQMVAQFPDSIEVKSQEYRKLKARCRGRLASLTSPGDTVEVMFELMKEDEGRLYLDYWDFDILGEKALTSHWEGMTAQQRDKILAMAKDLINDGLKQQNQEAVQAVKVEVTNQTIEGNVAQVEVAFQVGSLLETDFTLELNNEKGPWKVTDITSHMTGDKYFTSYLAAAFDEVLKDQTVEEFINSDDPLDQIGRAFDSTAGDELNAVGDSKKGRKIRVIMTTQIMSGNKPLGVVDEGTVFEVMQDQPHEGKRWFLVLFHNPSTGKDEVGWLSSEFVEVLPVEEENGEIEER